MSYDPELLLIIFEKTNGQCHLCHGRMTFEEYGRYDLLTGWEVDHSVPLARGGTHRLSNLFAAHTSCNRSKQDRSTRSVRAGFGHTRAPASRAQVIARKQRNEWLVAGACLAVGIAALGIASTMPPRAPHLLPGS